MLSPIETIRGFEKVEWGKYADARVDVKAGEYRVSNRTQSIQRPCGGGW